LSRIYRRGLLDEFGQEGQAMTRILVDEVLRSRLLNLDRRIELCDESGRVVARVLPTYDSSKFEGLEPQITKEELERRKQNKGKTYTTAEVIAHLEKL
jgi:hypothetical protein